MGWVKNKTAKDWVATLKFWMEIYHGILFLNFKNSGDGEAEQVVSETASDGKIP